MVDAADGGKGDPRAGARALPSRRSRSPGNLDARVRRALRRVARQDRPGGRQRWASVRSCVHTLGGTFNLPHAEVHTVVLPQATAYNRDLARDAMKIAADALGAADAAQGVLRPDGHDRRPAVRFKTSACPPTASNAPPELATDNRSPNPRPMRLVRSESCFRNTYKGGTVSEPGGRTRATREMARSAARSSGTVNSRLPTPVACPTPDLFREFGSWFMHRSWELTGLIHDLCYRAAVDLSCVGPRRITSAPASWTFPPRRPLFPTDTQARGPRRTA